MKTPASKVVSFTKAAQPSLCFCLITKKRKRIVFALTAYFLLVNKATTTMTMTTMITATTAMYIAVLESRVVACEVGAGATVAAGAAVGAELTPITVCAVELK